MISISGFAVEGSGWNFGVLFGSPGSPREGTVSGRGSDLPPGKYCCRHSWNLSMIWLINLPSPNWRATRCGAAKLTPERRSGARQRALPYIFTSIQTAGWCSQCLRSKSLSLWAATAMLVNLGRMVPERASDSYGPLQIVSYIVVYIP